MIKKSPKFERKSVILRNKISKTGNKNNFRKYYNQPQSNSKDEIIIFD